MLMHIIGGEYLHTNIDQYFEQILIIAILKYRYWWESIRASVSVQSGIGSALIIIIKFQSI